MTLKLGERDTEIARPLAKEIKSRLSFMQAVGLEYLSLDRASMTLSGGEAQRIRLATQVGSALQGVVYVLDEPHPSACTNAITNACCAPCCSCTQISATPCWWSSTTKRPFARPITSSISARALAVHEGHVVVTGTADAVAALYHVDHR